MAKRVKIPGRLESAETGNIVTGADAVMDDEKGKTQVVINSEVDAAIINLAQGKQDNLTFDSAPTEGSPNPVTSAGVYTADKVLSDAIEAILLLIPSAASALNKLVDMQTMNSSIATATASFKGTYNLVSDLHLGVDATHEQIGAALDALSLGADNNDYAFVQVPNSATAPTEISKTERYKFNGENWLFEYDLNNSGFTQGQWNAINSGVTSLLVSKLSDLPTNAELTALLAGKQDNLTFDNVPTAGSPNPVKSGGVYARNNEIVALINALDAAKQDVLTFDNAPVQGSPNPVKSGGVYTAISAVQAAIVALDAAKQNVLTFDNTPTLGSPNPVTSSGIKTELNRIDGNITTLNDLYEALTQGALVIIAPTDTWPVASPATKTIYRVVDRVNTPPQNYSDYMWNGTAMVLMATYDNAIDDEPTAGSNNLVKSGGVDIRIRENGAYIYKIDTFYDGTLVTSETSGYMKWGVKTKPSGNVPYVEWTNNTGSLKNVALYGLVGIGQPLTYKNITVVNDQGQILNEKCINDDSVSDASIVGVVVPTGCKVFANASRLYYGVTFVENNACTPLDYTKNAFSNKVIRELYIDGYTITNNTTVLVRNHFSGNNQWSLYIYEGGTSVVGNNWSTKPSSDDVIFLESGAVKVYAVINWDVIKDGEGIQSLLNAEVCTNPIYSPIINGYINKKEYGNSLEGIKFAQFHDVVAYNPIYSGWQGNVTTETVVNSILGFECAMTKISIGNRTDVNTLAVDFSSFVASGREGDVDMDWYFYSPVAASTELRVYNAGSQVIRFVTNSGLTDRINQRINIGLNKIKFHLRIQGVGNGTSQIYFGNPGFANTVCYSLANIYYSDVPVQPTYLKSERSSYIYAVGDSLMAAGTLETKLASLLADKVRGAYNYGIGGEGVGTIFGRLNTIPMKLAADVIIPASGSVSVTLKNDYGSWLLPLLQSGNSHSVTIGGVKGTLSTTAASGDTSATYLFLRDWDGSAISVTEGEPVLFAPSEKYGGIPSGSYQIIWVGQNGGYSANPETGRYQPSTITESDVNNLVNMIKCHTDVTNPKKYLVLSPTEKTNATLESILSKAFGGSFVNVRKQLVDNGIRIALEKGYLSGDYPTAQDEQDIANGIIPTSLRVDQYHLNTAGYNTLAEILKIRIDNLWGL